MSRSSLAQRVVRILAVVVPTVPFVLGADLLSLADAAKPDADDPGPDGNKVGGQAVYSLCEPILGSGKTTGIPIRVQDAGGNWLNDLTGLTFELTDGTNTQTVTSYIKTPEQEQLITGQTLTAYGSLPESGFGSAFAAFGTAKSATGPTLNVSNTGFYFLDCTPNSTDSTAVFNGGIDLQAKSGGTIISKGSVRARSAQRIAENESTSANGPTMTAITPSGASNTDFEKMYSDYLTLTGIRFRPAFAAMAIMEMSNSTASSGGSTVTCWDDLTSVTGSTWTWTTAGQNFIDELTSSSATTWPILAARTKGLAGPTVGSLNPCDLSISTQDDDAFMNMLGAQLLLIDGPRGNVPTTITDSVSALLPAVELKAVSSSTTTTSSSSTTSTSSTSSTSTSSTSTSSTSTTTSTSTSTSTSSTTSTSTSSTVAPASSTTSSTAPSGSTSSSTTAPGAPTTTSSPPRTTVPRTTVPRRTTSTSAPPTITIADAGGWSSTTTTSTTTPPITTTTVPDSTQTTDQGSGGDILPPFGFRPIRMALVSLITLLVGLFLVESSRRRQPTD